MIIKTNTGKKLKELAEEQLFDLYRFGLKVINISEKLSNQIEDFRIAEIQEEGMVSPRTHEIAVMVPFIFNHKWIPKQIEGYDVRVQIDGDTFPEEFDVPENMDVALDIYWGADRYEAFVDNNLDSIKSRLEMPELDREEALNILTFCCDFELHKQNLAAQKANRISRGIPDYKDAPTD